MVMRGGWREDRAQATVELALMAPVLIVLALAVYNLMVFTAAVARFDRVAPDIVIAEGVSPAAVEEAGAPAVEGRIAASLEEAMGSYPVTIAVEATTEGTADDGAGSALALVGPLRTYTCTMRYAPWPQGFALAGVSLGAPVQLVHERPVTIDPWRSGVVA